MSVELFRMNIGQNRSREQTGNFDRSLATAVQGRAYVRGRNRMRRYRLNVDGAGRSLTQDPRVIRPPRMPLFRQLSWKRGFQIYAGARHDNDVRELEELAPAMPFRKAVKGVGADQQQQRTLRFFIAQARKRIDGVALAPAFDLARVDAECGQF